MHSTAGWDWNMTALTLPRERMIHTDYARIAPVPLDFPSSVLTPGQQQASSDVVASCPSLELDDGISPSESIDDLADQLSDRVGTLYIRSGGHIRFYGSTSNFNLLETQPAEVSMNVHRTVRNDGTEQLDRLGINKKVPPEIETHLMNLYFTWQDPSFHVVDRIMFEDAKEAWHSMTEDTAYYSEALRNAM
jgi:hypothetical protein